MRFSIRDLLWVTVVVVLGATTSCARVDMKTYQATHKHGLSVIGEAKEIETLLRDADHFITHFGFGGEKTNTWNTQVFFGGRYALTMTVEVEIDYPNGRIQNIAGEPAFLLTTYERISTEANGNKSARTASEARFGRKEWEKIFKNEGDFSVVGVKIQSGTGLAGFDEFVGAMRRPRVRIEH